ncbi:uncharacterized protein RJT21DRAFT_48824 [Scheffersomyces amazonensis]|uniref:uncharacterized protein n=1 Tax=Scheffersomyces amazonensis TaxID=1078765 RepID=UPI00315C560B
MSNPIGPTSNDELSKDSVSNELEVDTSSTVPSSSDTLPQTLNQDAIIQKLKAIPLDKLKEVITNQIDLEIRLKHKELKLTEMEVGKIESQMLILRKFFEVPNDVKIDNEPNEFTLKYFDLLNKSLTLTYNDITRQNQRQQSAGSLFNSDYLDGYDHSSIDYNPYSVSHSYRTRSTTSSLRPLQYNLPLQPQPLSITPQQSISQSSNTPTITPNASQQNLAAIRYNNQNLGCLYRRTDGVIVKLTCPDCQRSNFSSAQGFLNHSRIAHSKEYTSQDAAALKCGSIIPEIRQDPTGEHSIQRLIEKGIDPNRNLNVNEVQFNGINNNGVNSIISDVGVLNNSNVRNSISNSNTRNSSIESTSNLIKTSSSESLSTPTPHFETKYSDGELLRKIVKEGKMKKEEYEKLIDDTRKPLTNAHLFDDEFEEDSEAIESGNSSTNLTKASSIANARSKIKRRKSRGGINITITRGDSGLEIEGDDEGEDEEEEEEREQQQQDREEEQPEVIVKQEDEKKHSTPTEEPDPKRRKSK